MIRIVLLKGFCTCWCVRSAGRHVLAKRCVLADGKHSAHSKITPCWDTKCHACGRDMFIRIVRKESKT